MTFLPGKEKPVKGTRHSEEQIIAILKQGEAGVATAELCRQLGAKPYDCGDVTWNILELLFTLVNLQT
jgi:Transposase